MFVEKSFPPHPVELLDHEYECSKQQALQLLCIGSIGLPLCRRMLMLDTHNIKSAEQFM